jgi:hypothetical protein
MEKRSLLVVVVLVPSTEFETNSARRSERLYNRVRYP